MAKKQIVLAILGIGLALSNSAQVTTDKVLGPKHEVLIDSLKHTTYPYLLPIWGQKVKNKGFSMPLPVGASVQYLWQESDIIINNLQVGFNHGPMYNMDDIVRIENAVTTTNGYNFRPDFYVFPFLNVYGILAKSKTSTAIDAGLWIPDSSSSWKKISDFSTKADFNATTMGFGLTPMIGVGGFFFTLDMNFSWSDIDELEKPAYVFVLGPRLGKNIRLKKERSIALWAGGFRVHMKSGTTGSLNVGELLPVAEWQQKVSGAQQKVGEAQGQVDTWWADLTPTEQKNPVNIAKHEAANAALTKTGQVLNSVSQAVNSAGDATVQYSLEKKPKDKWNFILGSQFQLTNNWMLRVEYGFLSSRHQLIAGLQYRFGF